MRSASEIIYDLEDLYREYTDYTKEREKEGLGTTLKNWFLGNNKERRPENINFYESVEHLTDEMLKVVEATETEDARQILAARTCEILFNQPVRKKGGDDRDLYVAAMMSQGKKFLAHISAEDAPRLIEIIDRLPSYYMMPVQMEIKKELKAKNQA